jgi:dipeptidyl aminopeptidase/acylaminoacyl peptidase
LCPKSVILADALKRASIPATFHTVDGAGHGFQDETANEQVVNFFNQYLARKK